MNKPQYLKKYNLKPTQATFIGASKGANIALMASERFKGNKLILCSPAIDLQFWIQNTGMAHIGQSLEFFGRDFPDSHQLFLKEAKLKETHWFYSKNDPKANRNLEEIITAKKLVKHASDAAHGATLLSHWDEISEIIQQQHP